jgi:adenosylcobinamide kinase / adenosylcobinamide-phosphate guanylyltransferase
MSGDRSSSRTIILITGAASSGKSEWAETLATKTNKSVIYIATAQINLKDKEWLAKIEKHQQRRPVNWKTLEVPFNLNDALELASLESCLLVDSLGTWVANLISVEQHFWEETSQQLINNLKIAVGEIIFVAEETGWGLVPEYRSGRIFRDRLGKLIRQIGSIADRVYLVTSGHALDLKKIGNPLSSNEL